MIELVRAARVRPGPRHAPPPACVTRSWRGSSGVPEVCVLENGDVGELELDGRCTRRGACRSGACTSSAGARCRPRSSPSGCALAANGAAHVSVSVDAAGQLAGDGRAGHARRARRDAPTRDLARRRAHEAPARRSRSSLERATRRLDDERGARRGRASAVRRTLVTHARFKPVTTARRAPGPADEPGPRRSRRPTAPGRARSSSAKLRALDAAPGRGRCRASCATGDDEARARPARRAFAGRARCSRWGAPSSAAFTPTKCGARSPTCSARRGALRDEEVLLELLSLPVQDDGPEARATCASGSTGAAGASGVCGARSAASATGELDAGARLLEALLAFRVEAVARQARWPSSRGAPSTSARREVERRRGAPLDDAEALHRLAHRLQAPALHRRDLRRRAPERPRRAGAARRHASRAASATCTTWTSPSPASGAPRASSTAGRARAHWSSWRACARERVAAFEQELGAPVAAPTLVGIGIVSAPRRWGRTRSGRSRPLKHDVLRGLVARGGRDAGDFLHDVDPGDDRAEDGVLVVEVRRRRAR